MQGFVIPIRFRMFQSETYLRENEILEKKKIFKCGKSYSELRNIRTHIKNFIKRIVKIY